MAKTQITKTPNGWVDNDDPTTTYPNRRAARAGRRQTLVAMGKTAHLRSLRLPAQATSLSRTPSITSVVVNWGAQTPTSQPLTGLQQRLYNRLTSQQGVSAADAFDVVSDNGYNKAASYGHMREAGATHEEALSVIDLGEPDVSRAYGELRSFGFDHDKSLKAAQNDDD